MKNFAEYDLFKPTIFIHNFIFIDFRIILTQVCINFLRPGSHGYRSTPKMLGFSPYPLLFFLYSPFKYC